MGDNSGELAGPGFTSEVDKARIETNWVYVREEQQVTLMLRMFLGWWQGLDEIDSPIWASRKGLVRYRRHACCQKLCIDGSFSHSGINGSLRMYTGPGYGLYWARNGMDFGEAD